MDGIAETPVACTAVAERPAVADVPAASQTRVLTARGVCRRRGAGTTVEEAHVSAGIGTAAPRAGTS